MKGSEQVPVRRVSWSEVSEDVKIANPGLCAKLIPIMKRLEANKRKPYFFVATYPYGELLVDNGSFRLPSGSKSLNTNDETLNDLKYSPIPLCLVLDRSVEVFVERAAGYSCPDEELRGSIKRTVPLSMIGRGELFGVFESLDTIFNVEQRRQPPWSVSSGAHTVVVLTQLGNKDLIDKLSRNVGAYIPDGKGRPDWELIQCVNNSKKFMAKRWEVKVLIFPSWITQSGEDFALLQNIIAQSGWMQTVTIRDYLIEEAAVAEFYMRDGAGSQAKDSNELYHYFTVRHLLALSKGDLPALNVATAESAQAGPFALFQAELLETGMMRYFPVIFQPVRLSDDNRVGFYSVTMPTLLAPVPNATPWSREKWKFLQAIALAIHALKHSSLEKACFDKTNSMFFRKSVGDTSKKLHHVNDIDESELIPDSSLASTDKSSDKKGPLNKGFAFFDGAVRIVRK